MRRFPRSALEAMKQYGLIARWLKAHPRLWRGKKIEYNDETWREISWALKKERFYSMKTSSCDIRVNKLLEMTK